jgi:hypothetical protein
MVVDTRIEATHEFLLKLVKPLPTDFAPWGERNRDEDWGPDCSCGCRHFLPLDGELRFDWGVCANPRSPRASLLTFQHMGCREFEADADRMDPSHEDAPHGHPPHRTSDRGV